MVDWLKWSEIEVREKGGRSILRNKHDVKMLDSLVDFTVIFVHSQDSILGVWVG